MEPALVMSSAIALLLGAVLALEGAVRVLIRLSSLRLVDVAGRRVGGLMIVALLAGALIRSAPAAAETPPAAVRMTEASNAAEPLSTDVQAPNEFAGTHTVVSGECLWRIAKELLLEQGVTADGESVTRTWKSIYGANRELIGDDPNLIHPGQVLTLPEALHGP